MATANHGDRSNLKRRLPVQFAIAALAAMPALLANAPAAARDYAAQTVGGWTVAASKDETGCFATRNYARRGDTSLLFGLDLDGKNRLTVLNANWSIKPGDRLKLDFTLARGSYADHFAVGIAADGKQGFVSSFGSKFPASFAASDRLTISRGKVPVERLDLNGSGAALAELRRCLATIGGTSSQSGTDDEIPVDPFAPEPKSGNRK